ncbi:MAG: hypothetical protein R3E32_15570 [Chitinophagales bacterium]
MMDKIISKLREKFAEIEDHRSHNISYELEDLLSIGYAMFSLKDSSLSRFRDLYPVRRENLKRVYGIEKLLGDTAFRGGLDGVSPSDIESIFKVPINILREKMYSKNGMF